MKKIVNFSVSFSGVFFIAAQVAGCATSQSIQLKSTPPGATVFVNPGGSGVQNKRVKVGSTPTKYSASNSLSPLTFQFEREGFVPREVVVAAPYQMQADIAVQLNTFNREWFREMLKTDLATEVNALVDELNDLPEDLNTKTDVESDKQIQKLSEKYLKFASFHVICGNFYYGRKNTAKAKSHFQEALKLKPEDTEAKNMLGLIDRL
jgi:hypothetical protein